MSAPSVSALLWPRLAAQRNRFLRASRGERAMVVVLGLVGLLAWAGLFVLFGWLVDTAYSVEVFGPIITRRLLEMLLIGLFSLLCFSNTITAIGAFYLSEDLELVLSLPVRRETFFYARFIDAVVQSSWMMGFFGAPVFAAYGYAYGGGWSYLLALIGVLPGFVLIPGGLGALVAAVLVRGIPAHRVREAMAFVGVLALGAVLVLLRLLRPERLVNAEDFQSLAAYVAELQTPLPALFPPRWAVDVVEASLRDKALPMVELGLLLSGGVAMVGVARWVTEAVYDEARAKAQAARAARMARSGLLDRALALWTWPLPRPVASVVIKDVKGFLRDPAQWSQLFVVAAIVAIAMASAAAMPTDFLNGPIGVYLREVLSFGALTMVGFILASLAARFQFTAVSLEGRAFWIVRTAPLRPEQLLLAKLWPGLLPMVVIGEVLALGIGQILGAGAVVMGVSAFTALAMALGIAGLAVGMGALYPDFKADNAARVAASPPAMLFMLAAMGLVFAVAALEVIPVAVSMSLRFNEREPVALDWLGLLLPHLAVGLLCAAALLLPMRWAAVRLWARELPNS